ncbi:MAG: hypothetical protein EOP47_24945, partial [Sphingobacteriaceae bacterium]
MDKSPFNNLTGIPVFFLQFGKSPKFINKILQQAQYTNGKENVYFLTDTDTHLYKEFNCIDISKYAGACEEFGKVYQHYSVNLHFYEKACIDRWFIINALVKEFKIPWFFYADCDLLILEDLTPVHHKLTEQNYAGGMMFYSNIENDITSAHSSFWSAELLNEFCLFTYNIYADATKFEALLADSQTTTPQGGIHISDMTLIEVFRKQTSLAILSLLSLQSQDICFDMNINMPDNGLGYNFIMNGFLKIKKLRKRKDGVFGIVAGKGEMKFYTLHFQGYFSKFLIPLYMSASSLNIFKRVYVIQKYLRQR